jgi:hypothetical protein
MNPLLLAGIVAALQAAGAVVPVLTGSSSAANDIEAALNTLGQILPEVLNAIGVLKSGTATQADADAAVSAMDAAVKAYVG